MTQSNQNPPPELNPSQPAADQPGAGRQDAPADDPSADVTPTSGEAMSKPIFRLKIGGASGYLPTSIAVSLTGAQAQTLAQILAAEEQGDWSHAVGWILDRIAAAKAS